MLFTLLTTLSVLLIGYGIYQFMRDGVGNVAADTSRRDLFAALAGQMHDETDGPTYISHMDDEDSLVIVAQNDALPDVRVEADGADAIVLDHGTVLARVVGAARTLSVDQITVIPISAAAPADTALEQRVAG